MKKLLILLALLSVIIFHNDSNKKVIVNLYGEIGEYKGCLFGGEIKSLEAVRAKEYTGNLFIRHFIYEGEKGVNIFIPSLKSNDKVIIHLPLFKSNMRDGSYKNLIIREKDL